MYIYLNMYFHNFPQKNQNFYDIRAQYNAQIEQKARDRLKGTIRSGETSRYTCLNRNERWLQDLVGMFTQGVLVSVSCLPVMGMHSHLRQKGR